MNTQRASWSDESQRSRQHCPERPPAVPGLHFLACGRPWPGLPLYPLSHSQDLSGQLDRARPLGTLSGAPALWNPLLAVPGRPRGCRAWPSAHPGASGRWGGGCSDNGGATCEGESVLVYFLLEVFDLKVPLLQQLVQSPVLIRCFPELMAKLFDLIFQHPARQRHPGLLFLPGDPRAGIGASLPRAVVPRWALGGDQNWSVQNRKAKLETSQ